MTATRAPIPYRAWLVAYVDPRHEPPSICEAGIFPDHCPIKAERHNGLAQLVLLQAEAPTYAGAAEQIKQIVSGPEWRWLYKVPVLAAGFQPVWLGDPPGRRCRTCGVPDQDLATREAGGRDPDRCFVSHVGTCSGCGQRKAILQGDALCALCRYPSR